MAENVKDTCSLCHESVVIEHEGKQIPMYGFFVEAGVNLVKRHTPGAYGLCTDCAMDAFGITKDIKPLYSVSELEAATEKAKDGEKVTK